MEACEGRAEFSVIRGRMAANPDSSVFQSYPHMGRQLWALHLAWQVHMEVVRRGLRGGSV